MFRPLARSLRRPPRKGTSFTLIAVSMLTLFAAVGMGYALFGHTVQKQAQRHAEAQGQGGAPALDVPDPTGTLNRFLGSLTYGVPYDATATEPNALTNALRGNEIVRSMYGLDQAALNAGFPITAPWSGVGTFHETNGFGDRGLQVNYTLLRIGGNPFLLDPEYTGARTVTGGNPVTPFDPNAAGRFYVNKAAGYSFADNKDFFLATVDPVTGQVLVPSFFRYSSLGTNTLAPTSAFWGNDANKLTMLRPWPNDHPQFPRIGPNADGSYTGDVQNLPGGVGTQKNDSFWMDIGAPVFTWNGKRIKPMVAPLIVPLNGLLNATAHGRTTPASPTGFGPWDVNLAAALTNNSANVATARGAPQQRNGLNQRAFAPFPGSGPLPGYSPVAWRATPTGAPVYPAGADLSGQPNFNGLETDNNPQPNHPSLFNPTQWPSGGGTTNRAYATTDVKRLLSRYAFMRNFYQDGDLPPQAPNDLIGTQPFLVAPTQTQVHAWRTDPANANRFLVTPFGFDLQRPKVTPQFTSGALALAAGNFKPVHPAATQPYPAAGSALQPSADFAQALPGGQPRWTNALAALGSVDLNRPLADYRTDTTVPLSAANVGGANADADRQALARDVFVRLVAATGGAATINPSTGAITAINAAPGTNEYNALRYLAQVAANVVDYVDNDDVSTVFVWNPDGTNPTGADFANPADVNNRVVFGVEKPRLLINESRGEIVNDPADPVVDPGNLMLPAGAFAHVRFWFELANPSVNPTVNAPIPGAVDLTKYRIEVARSNRVTGVAAAQALGAALNDPANVSGGFGTLSPDIAYSFPAAGITAVGPNNGAYDPAGPKPNNGIVLVGPEVAMAKPNEFNPPTAAGSVWESGVNAIIVTGAAASPSANAMAYTLTMPAGAVLQSREFREHTVLLRRAANPYLAPNDPTVTTGPYAYNAANPLNPYVTVDKMEYVPAFDGVHRDAGAVNPRTPRPAANPMGAAREYDPEDQRFSVGKVQPFAGYAQLANPAGNDGPGNYNQYTFPQSVVLAQTAQRAAGASRETFGRHNGNGAAAPANTVAGSPPALTAPETLMAPFDWFVHMDRPLVNAVELFHVRDTAGHFTSDRFLRFNAGNNALDYEQGVGAWRASAGLARALEFLTVRPYTVGVPHGGRDPGRINPNAVQDQRVALAQFDPQGGNLFNGAFVTNTVWNLWMNTRSGVGQQTAANGTSYQTANAPGQSVYDANAAGGNRPFFALGAPAVAGGSALAFGAGGSENDTILRRDPAQPLPYLFNTGATGTYFQAEPLRKTFNTSTTVNHQYAVFFTVGYFDVTSETAPAGWPSGVPYAQLGAETYLSVPGDMRQKFVSVVDMSAMALDPVANQPAGASAAGRPFAPFFTTLDSTTYGPGPSVTLNITQSSFSAGTNQLFVAADGQEIEIRGNDKLVIGYGADQQIVTVTNVANGQVTVTADSGTFRTAWGGSSVSNVRPGYAGPQSGFSYSDPRFKPVVPYVERLK